MKKLCSVIIVILLIISLTATAYALVETKYIIDLGNILTTDEVLSLDSRAQDISTEYSLAIRILTVNSLGEKSAQRFADDYYDENMLQLFSGDGILLVVSMTEREWAVTTNGLTHQVVTDTNIDDIMYDVLPDLSAGYYYDAFDSFLNGILQEYQHYESGTEDGEMSIGEIIPIALLIGIAAGGITILIMRSSMKTARPQQSATSYIKKGSFQLTNKCDFYLYSRTTRRPKPKNNSSGGRSGGGSRGGRSGGF